ncbi:MAG: hypothetical protein PHP92_04050 [Candidatus Nanoarchaeia archaeon]|nr:hypothetical protein [Candidatus Nanoarchaeia archaeon]
MNFYLDYTQDEVQQKKEEILNFTQLNDKIVEFWIREYEELLNYGGKNVILKLSNGNQVKGVLSGLSPQDIEINNSLKFYFDDVDFIIVQNDKKEKKEEKINFIYKENKNARLQK